MNTKSYVNYSGNPKPIEQPRFAEMPLGLSRRSSTLEPYDPDWPMLFERERQRIEKAIGHIAAGVHHVGSTSIPGMPAKPILDIAVLLHDFDDGERCIEPLEKIGYLHMGVMDDIPGDRVFHRGYDLPGGCHDSGDKSKTDATPAPKRLTDIVQTHILHMYAVDNPVRQHHLHFRDYLIAHPEVAADYAELKVALSNKHPGDRKSYSAGKRSFIAEVLTRAAQEFG